MPADATFGIRPRHGVIATLSATAPRAAHEVLANHGFFHEIAPHTLCRKPPYGAGLVQVRDTTTAEDDITAGCYRQLPFTCADQVLARTTAAHRALTTVGCTITVDAALERVVNLTGAVAALASPGGRPEVIFSAGAMHGYYAMFPYGEARCGLAVAQGGFDVQIRAGWANLPLHRDAVAALDRGIRHLAREGYGIRLENSVLTCLTNGVHQLQDEPQEQHRPAPPADTRHGRALYQAIITGRLTVHARARGNDGILYTLATYHSSGTSVVLWGEGDTRRSFTCRNRPEADQLYFQWSGHHPPATAGQHTGQSTTPRHLRAAPPRCAGPLPTPPSRVSSARTP